MTKVSFPRRPRFAWGLHIFLVFSLTGLLSATYARQITEGAAYGSGLIALPIGGIIALIVTVASTIILGARFLWAIGSYEMALKERAKIEGITEEDIPFPSKIGILFTIISALLLTALAAPLGMYMSLLGMMRN